MCLNLFPKFFNYFCETVWTTTLFFSQRLGARADWKFGCTTFASRGSGRPWLRNVAVNHMWEFRDLFCLKNIAERCFFRSNHYLLCHFADCNLICSKFIVCSPQPMFWVLWKLQLTQIPEVFQRNSRTVFLGWIRSSRKPKKIRRGQRWKFLKSYILFYNWHWCGKYLFVCPFIHVACYAKTCYRLPLYWCMPLLGTMLVSIPWPDLQASISLRHFSRPVLPRDFHCCCVLCCFHVCKCKCTNVCFACDCTMYTVQYMHVLMY